MPRYRPSAAIAIQRPRAFQQPQARVTPRSCSTSSSPTASRFACRLTTFGAGHSNCFVELRFSKQTFELGVSCWSSFSRRASDRWHRSFVSLRISFLQASIICSSLKTNCASFPANSPSRPGECCAFFGPALPVQPVTVCGADAQINRVRLRRAASVPAVVR